MEYEYNTQHDIMNLAEFMAYLNIGKTTAYKLLKSGKIKVFRIGRVFKIPKKSVDEYIEAMRQ